MQNFRNYRPLTRAWGDATRNRCRFGAFRPPNHRFRQTFCTRPPQKRKPQERRTMNGMKIDSRARANEKATGRGSMGRGVEANLDARNNRIAGSQRHRRNRSQRAGHGKRIAGIASPRHRAQVNKKAPVPGSISTTGRTQVSEKGPGAGDRGDREGEAYFGTRVLGIAARSGARALRSVEWLRRPEAAATKKPHPRPEG